jgi:hypothetical protein
MTISKTLEPYVCGGTAATFGSCCIHPMDLAKVSLVLVFVCRRDSIHSFEFIKRSNQINLLFPSSSSSFHIK